MLYALGLASLSFQPGQLRPLPQHARAASVSMEYRLNNYIIGGPLKPLGNQVLVKPRKADDKTGGGLFIATEEVQKPKEGVVVSAGPGRVDETTGQLIACPVKDGDVVLLSDANSGEKIEYNDEKHLFLDADTLLGRFDDPSMSFASFNPFGDRVVVEIKEAATETTTGIALAGSEEEEGNQGMVAAVGPGRRDGSGSVRPVDISAGESVLFKGYAGSEAEIDGKRYKIVDEDEVLAKW